jgi:hypothetical protein
MAVDTGTTDLPEAPPAAAPRLDRDSVLADYRLGWTSREASLLGRREVLTGKAKFGIFGDGKEVAQLAMARACRPGDWRSGYYRDQTLMMALGLLTVEQLFAQLYAHTDPAADPASAGRQMNAHFATRFVDACELGARAVRLLVQPPADSNGDPPREQQVLPAPLIIRKSCGAGTNGQKAHDEETRNQRSGAQQSGRRLQP